MEPLWLRILFPSAVVVAVLASLFGVATIVHGCATWSSTRAIPWEIVDAGFSALAAGCASGIAAGFIAITKVR